MRYRAYYKLEGVWYSVVLFSEYEADHWANQFPAMIVMEEM